MAHAPIFAVEVEEWDGKSKSARPRAVHATCHRCSASFRATAAERTGAETFATYLGAIHLKCPGCGAEGPVQLRRLKP